MLCKLYKWFEVELLLLFYYNVPPKASGDFCECLSNSLASAQEGKPAQKRYPAPRWNRSVAFCSSHDRQESLSVTELGFARTEGNSHRPLGKDRPLGPNGLGGMTMVSIVSNRNTAE